MPGHDNASGKGRGCRINSSQMGPPHRYSWETTIYKYKENLHKPLGSQ